METSLPFIGAIILVALAFDFINGFHDAANSIATIVSTRVLPPLWAVVWAAFFNFSAAFLFGTAVAKTVGSGMVHLEFVTPWVILAGLIGAIVWDLITWWFGLPTSSSHALPPRSPTGSPAPCTPSTCAARPRPRTRRRLPPSSTAARWSRGSRSSRCRWHRSRR